MGIFNFLFGKKNKDTSINVMPKCIKGEEEEKEEYSLTNVEKQGATVEQKLTDCLDLSNYDAKKQNEVREIINCSIAELCQMDNKEDLETTLQDDKNSLYKNLTIKDLANTIEQENNTKDLYDGLTDRDFKHEKNEIISEKNEVIEPIISPLKNKSHKFFSLENPSEKSKHFPICPKKSKVNWAEIYYQGFIEDYDYQYYYNDEDEWDENKNDKFEFSVYFQHIMNNDEFDFENINYFDELDSEDNIDYDEYNFEDENIIDLYEYDFEDENIINLYEYDFQEDNF